eukprot:sb/3462801/
MTEKGYPTCRYTPLPGCNSSVIAVNQYDQRIQKVWMDGTGILTTRQGQVCADTFDDSLAGVFCSIFGFAAATHSVSEIVDNTNVSHLVCENDICYAGQDPPCTEGVVKLECSNPNGVEYQFLNGTEDARTITGVIGAVWNSELTIINLNEPKDELIQYICGMLGFSSEVGSFALQIRTSLKPKTDKLLVGNWYNCPLGMEDNYCHGASEVESKSAEKYFPYDLTCSFRVENLTFLVEEMDSIIGYKNFRLRVQYDVIYSDRSVQVVGSITFGDGKDDKDGKDDGKEDDSVEDTRQNLCLALGATSEMGGSSMGNAVSVTSMNCKGNVRKDTIGDVCNFNLTNVGGDFESSYYELNCRNQSVVYWLKDGPLYQTSHFPVGTLMATVTKKGGIKTTPVSNEDQLLNAALDQFKSQNLTTHKHYEYQPELYDFDSSESITKAGFTSSGQMYTSYTFKKPFIWLEFYTFPKVAESSMSYRLINGNGFPSLYEGLLLVSYDLTNETGGTKGSVSDGLVCQKNLSIEVMESACERMGFSELLSHRSGDSYISAEKYDFAIGVGFKGVEFHYKEGKGECVNKSEAVVVNCGIDMAPNASFNDLTFNLVADQSSLPSDPLLSSDWVSPLYRDPTVGYLLVTVSVLGKISTGMVCSEGVSEATKMLCA